MYGKLCGSVTDSQQISDLPPYYTPTFFDHIHSASNEVPTLSTRQWYNYLLCKEVMVSDQAGVLTPCPAELASPVTDWAAVWRRVRGNITSMETATWTAAM